MIPVLPRRPRSDYIDPPTRIQKRTPAGKRGWAAGWPDACPRGSTLAVLSIPRPGDDKVFHPDCDARLADLFTEFLTFGQELGYPLIGALEANALGKKQGGMGAFSCRAIKGSNPPQPSNHSSGTALDLWTLSNPMRVGYFANGEVGKPVEFVSTIHPHLVELAAAADIYWGGWYWDNDHWYVDAMHFEYMRRPQDVAASRKRLRAKAAEIRKRLAPEPPEDPIVTPEQVMLLQTKLNALGTNPALAVDGDFGAATEAALQGVDALVAAQVAAAEAAERTETKQEAVNAVSAI